MPTRERPIIFSSPMVRAILAGTKTQTRRIVKPQPHEDIGQINVGAFNPTVVDRHGEEQPGPLVFGAFDLDGEWGARSHYGQPGDRLWVKETYTNEPCLACDLGWGEGESGTCTCTDPPSYKADGTKLRYDNECLKGTGFSSRWRPSIFMPRWASRITLEVTGVRVQRLQEISDVDAVAEGIECGDGTWNHTEDGEAYARGRHSWFAPGNHAAHNAPSHAFRHLWDSINAKRAPWESNPFCWVISFRRIGNAK